MEAKSLRHCVLPQWGFLALGPDTEVATALRNGRLGDYAECPEFIFADARTHFDPTDGRGATISASPATRPPPGSNEDFTAHTNPPGTWLDFGKVATDGSLKINREANRLVIFPYPRDKSFRASLDLKALAPTAKRTKVQVRALAAETQRDLGPIDFKMEGGQMLLTFATPGAGRYVVTW